MFTSSIMKTEENPNQITNGKTGDVRKITPREGNCTDDQTGAASKVTINNLTLKFSDRCHVSINKTLAPLKLALFFFFGASASVLPFIPVYFKQLGLTIGELSTVYMILPPAQLLGPAVSGIIADKLGRSKPVLLANLILVMLSITSMLFIPSTQTSDCAQYKIEVQCHPQVQKEILIGAHCKILSNFTEIENCDFHCSQKLPLNNEEACLRNYSSECVLSTRYIDSQNPSSNKSDINEKIIECLTKSASDYVNINTSSTWCLHQLINNCNVSCHTVNKTEQETCREKSENTHLFIITLILLMLFHVFLSNCFRILDVTSMSMVKAHNSDFGRQRVFSILGVLIFSTFSGYILEVANPQKNEPINYSCVFYLFNALTLLTMLVVWKLEVKIDPPAKGMCKNTLKLLTSLDVMVFLMAVLIIGTAFGFSKIFSSWYLVDLKGTSFLLGLIPSVNSVIGLPFLFTSNWWVKKVGRVNLLVLGFLGYAVWCIGYSFLDNPWWALVYEICGIFTYHLLWVAVVTHSNIIAPVGLKATVVSTAGGIHYGIGKGSGSLVGGFIMSKFGGRIAYRVMAIICIASAFVYCLYLYARRMFTRKDVQISERDRKEKSSVEMFEKWTTQETFCITKICEENK